jgi:hypothetical protein
LTQEIDTTGAIFPVVADPRVSFGWFVYWRFSGSDVQRTWQPGLNVLEFAAIAGAKIPHGVAAAACATYAIKMGSGLAETFDYVRRRNRCVELKYTYSHLLLVGWKHYSC